MVNSIKHFSCSNSFRLLHLLYILTIFCASFTSADEAISRMSIVNRFMQRRMDMNLDIMDDQQHNLVFQKDHGSNKENCGEDQYFDQILDHKNEDNFIYKQRFQVNMKFFNASDSQQSPVVFLMIGGAGEIRKFWVCNERTGIAQMAKEHGAILVQLEHRFFWRNASADDWYLGNMIRLLTLDQALADIASFIPHFNRLHGLKNARWVAFGGSYAGSLAAWFRVKYPQLTVGAVASSAPIWPKVDFWEYVDTMEYDILRAEPYCYARVKNAFEQLVNMLHSDKGKADLDALYEATPKFSEMEPIDLTNFLSTIFGAWQDIVQNTYAYDRSLRETHNLTKACEMMKPDVRPGNGTPEQQGLYNVFWHVKKAECNRLGIPEAECKKNNFKFEDTIKSLKDVEGDYQYATTIARIWMSCNELGWFQTTDKEGSIFGDILSMNFYYTICREVIGTSAYFVEPKVAKSFAKLGNGCTFEATNLISTNGRLDPWSPLSIRNAEECIENGQKDYAKDFKDEKNHLVTVWTKGASHCADMYPPHDGEPEGLKLTRERIKAEVKYYLESGAPNAITAAGIFMLLPLMAFLATIPFGHFL